MRTLYLECNMGAAGDMLTAALLDLLPESEQVRIIDQLNHLGLPGAAVHAEKAAKCGITGTHMVVTIDGEEEHSLDVTQEHHHNSAGHDHEEQLLNSVDHNYEEHHHDSLPHDHEEHHHHDPSDHDHEKHHHHHHHTSMADVSQIVSAMVLPEDVRNDILAVYRLIAEAEGHAHGMPVEQIHFHEVGTMDAILDVTAVCLLVHHIHPEQILASPIRVGFGEVSCAHGILPVPAPATAYLLRDIPTYSGEIRGEMCTPTGAALLRYYVKDFTRQPVMRTEKIGYGMGTKNFPAANCVRAFLGETTDPGQGQAVKKSENSPVVQGMPSEDHAKPSDVPPLSGSQNDSDQILELRCNLDDMTGEEIGFAMQAILNAGARDVFTTPIGMKKNRPGTLLTVICGLEDKEKIVPVIFQNTTTLGIRETICQRSILTRTNTIIDTPYGKVPMKTASGCGVTRQKAEYDALSAIAVRTGKSLLEIQREIENLL